ncbi:hypothetical protein KCP78_08095 [Salmonella enterica subsp. enterica]|nr:hypothetical protein KCP78_08095 [Salmonella enterica subsp. enterica]
MTDLPMSGFFLLIHFLADGLPLPKMNVEPRIIAPALPDASIARRTGGRPAALSPLSLLVLSRFHLKP